MKTKLQILLAGVTVAGMSISSLSAHRSWIKPSATIVSGEGSWVTFDAASSNDLFYTNHRGMSLESIVVTSPKGEVVEKQNANEGEVRTTFDVEITEQGTYLVTSLRAGGYGASWQVGEERKRWRGTLEEFKSEEIFKNEGVTLMQNESKKLTFVTNGDPSLSALKPTNKGLELSFSESHPNDLIAEEKATFIVLFDGKPLAGVEVNLFQANDRFRDDKSPLVVTSDAAGKVVISWPAAGSYWLSAEHELEGEKLEGVPLKKRSSFSATLEVFSE